MTGLEIIPETAKALSGPVTKLVEVVAAGCGRLYGPTDIRRTAKASGDALVIMEEAETRRSEVALRAAQRLLDVEERRQVNIDAIVEQARLALPETVSSTEVEPDWSARFFKEAQDVSNEEMQLLWGKLLANEVARPGSFSQRTLRVVADLSPAEAELFEQLCSFRFVGLVAREPFLFCNDENEFLRKQGLNWSSLQRLVSAGLIHHHGLTGYVIEQAPSPFYFEAPGAILFVLTSATPLQIRLGKVSLTPAGVEMCQLARWIWEPDHVRDVIAMWRVNGWTVEAKTIQSRLDDGNVRIVDREMPV
jgi:hypothetical protein